VARLLNHRSPGFASTNFLSRDVCSKLIADASIKEMFLKLKEVLSKRQPVLVTNTDRITSAVLVPIYKNDGEYHIILTQRTNKVSTHKGQISFPGGVRDKTDASLADTALRECTEEVGLACEAVDILGQLDDCPTFVSHFIITPFVGAFPWPYEFNMNEMETSEIIDVPIRALLDETCRTDGSEIVDGAPMAAYFYTYKGKVIWGATARILYQFLNIWQEAAGYGTKDS
jgi:8-oxo-dGTP pyrophosphatase MutT (NUDIX family)